MNTIEENLKKALSELLVLALLCERDYHARELSTAIAEYSGGRISFSFPYSLLYRMIDQGYIAELPKRIAPDGRRRQFFGITPEGRAYFQEIWQTYQSFTAGVDRLVENACSLKREDGQK